MSKRKEIRYFSYTGEAPEYTGPGERARYTDVLRNLQELLWISTDRAHPYSFTRDRLERDLAAAGFSILAARVLARDPDRREMLWVCRKA